MNTTTSPKAVKNTSGRRVLRAAGAVALGVTGLLGIGATSASAGPSGSLGLNYSVTQAFGNVNTTAWVTRCGMYANFEFDTTIVSNDGPILASFVMYYPGMPGRINNSTGTGGQSALGTAYRNRTEHRIGVERFDLLIWTKINGTESYTSSPLAIDLNYPTFQKNLAVALDGYGSVKTAKVTIRANQVGPASFHC
jgi:hypothetical protein